MRELNNAETLETSGGSWGTLLEAVGAAEMVMQFIDGFKSGYNNSNARQI
jgi:imidazole glycerol phosphate synthase subunit HisF